MSNKLRGIHIDPYEQTVTEVEVDPKNFCQDIYRLCRCDMMEYVYRESKGRPIHMFIDEYGRISSPPQKPFAIFVDELNGEAEELMGPAVILGDADEEGNTQSAPPWCTPNSIRDLVLWQDRAHDQFPEHWLVKTLIINGPDGPHFYTVYMNPYHLGKLQRANPLMDPKDLNDLTEAKQYTGVVTHDLREFGFAKTQIEEIVKDAATNPIMQGIIQEAVDRVRIKIAEEVLKVDEKFVFPLEHPMDRMPKAQEKGK